MEIGFDTLAFFVERVDLIAATVDLDTPHLPAFVFQLLLELCLGLPGLLGSGIAGRKPGGKYLGRGDERQCCLS